MKILCVFLGMLLCCQVSFAENEKETRAKVLAPYLAKAYIKPEKPEKFWIEEKKLQPTLVSENPREVKSEIVVQAQELGFDHIKFYRLDGKLVAKNELQKILRKPTIVIVTEHQFDKTNEFYGCFDKQMLVICLDVHFDGDYIAIPDEAKRK